MLARKGIFAKPSITQPCKTRGGNAAKAYAVRLSVVIETQKSPISSCFERLFYHEAKMLACKGIFAKPSIKQPCGARGGNAAKAYAVRLSAVIIP